MSVACCGRMGGEAKLGSRYSQLPTITFVVFLRLERCTGMFRELTISSDVCVIHSSKQVVTRALPSARLALPPPAEESQTPRVIVNSNMGCLAFPSHQLTILYLYIRGLRTTVYQCAIHKVINFLWKEYVRIPYSILFHTIRNNLLKNPFQCQINLRRGRGNK